MGDPLSLRESSGEQPLPRRFWRLDLAERGRPGRERLERFVEARFEEAFGAQVRGHYPILTGLNGLDGAPRAAAGVRFAEAEPLFLERYLDAPVETCLASAFETPVSRDSVVEIGSLASVSAPATLELFGILAGWLASTHARRFAVATLRPDLARLLSRAGFGLRRIGAADPARVEDAARTWGDYYRQAPQVYAGEIRLPAPLGLLRARRAPVAELRSVAS